jgi:SlyX protein
MVKQAVNDEFIEQAIESLQVKLAYQEDTIEMLNQTVISQQKKISAMEDMLSKMADKIKAMPASDAQINDGVELPPHY